MSITVQEGNDGQNWRTLSGSTETTAAEGYLFSAVNSQIGTRYVRLKFVFSGAKGELAILAVGLNTSLQD